MKGMILAAGLGTRLRPLTFTRPKPLVPLGTRPLIGWAVEAYLRSGIDELIINLHHLPEPIERHVRATYGDRAGLHFSFEAEILGTGGAVKRVRPLVGIDEELFLVNGDTVQFPSFAELRERRRSHDALAALSLRHPPADDRFTSVWLDGERITGFGEGTGEPLMFAGAHCMAPRIFSRFPSRDEFGIVDRVYQPALAEGSETIAGLVQDGLWFDIGTPRRYLAADAAMLLAMRRGEVAVPQGSSLRGDAVLSEGAEVTGTASRSSIGAACRIEGSVEDSVLWEGCAIGPDVRLTRCIVADGVVLNGRLDLNETVICGDSPAIPPDLPRLQGAVMVSFEN